MNTQLLIKNPTIMTYFNDGYNAIKIHNCDILIENGNITKVKRDIKCDCPTIDACGKLAVPGFINGRSRSLVSKLTKGIAEDINTDIYGNSPIYTHVNPFLNLALDILSEEELASIIRLAIYEAIGSGTTTLFEHCSIKELPIFVKVCKEFGIRTVAAPTLMSRDKFPEADCWGNFDIDIEDKNPEDLVQWNRSLVEAYKKDDLVQVAMGLGSVDTVSERLLQSAAKAAMATTGIIMIPLNETRKEIEISLERYGTRPINVLHRNHVLHHRTLTGGNLYTTHEERLIMHGTSSQAVVCHYQAMLDAEIVPFIDFLIDDIDTISGTGRCSVNMLDQMHLLAISGKLESKRRYQMRAQDAFYAATVGGGRCIGMDIGVLEEGYKGDVVIIDWRNPAFHPLTMPVKELVYNTRTSDISDVIVGGGILKMNGKIQDIDAHKLIFDSKNALEKFWTAARASGIL